MVPKPTYPPIFHHPQKTRRLSPLDAQSQLVSFLTLTERQPYLHPDAQLSSSGITFAAQSGLRGGLAIHHLRRIEAGLRGENLVAETKEELEREFGLPAGDDGKVDAVIGGSGRKGGLKRKTVGESAESSSRVAEVPDEREAVGGAEADGVGGEWQDKETYEHAQQPLRGDVGNRSLAPVIQQNGAPPTIEHAAGPKDTKARRTAKRERKKAEKAARADRKVQG